MPREKKGAEKYFAQFEPGKSLIFYYAGYSNPFCENEEDNYVIAGISRVKKIEPTYYYDNTSAEVQKKYAGGLVWQRPVTSTYPDEGFCIPYWKYMDHEEIIERIILKPLNRSLFKYGSREVDNDDAIEVVNQLIAVVDVLIKIGDDTEDCVKRKEWLNSVLNELWTARGPYPGFSSVLEYSRAQKKVTIFLQQDIGTLTSLSRPEKSAVKKINSSVFKFAPLPDSLLYAKGNWYEDGKNVATLSKYFVRSKSEAIITNMLVDRDIPFKYEEPLYAPDGTMFLPDFTVKFKGEEYYWEHVGRLNDKNYMAHWAKKEAWYNKHFP